MRKTVLTFVTLVLFVVLLAAMFAFSGCISVKKYMCPDGKEVASLTDCEEQKSMPVEETVYPPVVESEPEPPVQNPSEIQSVFAKTAKVKTLKYNYAFGSDATAQNAYVVSREQMKIELKTKGVFSPTESFDTVYLDIVNAKAVGYCERSELSSCPDKNKPMNIDYNPYRVDTPFDWVNKITFAEPTGKSKKIESRNANEIKFKIGNDEGLMFIDSFTQVPISITFGGNTYEFRDLVVDPLGESLVHVRI